jgi:hypothetical protein
MFIPDAGPAVEAVSKAVLPSPDSSGFLMDAFAAFQRGNWRYLAALAVVFIVFVVRKYAPEMLAKGKWTWVVAVVVGALGALGNALAAEAPLHGVVGVLSILASGAFVGLGATGMVKGMKEWKGDK